MDAGTNWAVDPRAAVEVHSQRCTFTSHVGPDKVFGLEVLTKNMACKKHNLHLCACAPAAPWRLWDALLERELARLSPMAEHREPYSGVGRTSSCVESLCRCARGRQGGDAGRQAGLQSRQAKCPRPCCECQTIACHERTTDCFVSSSLRICLYEIENVV